MHIASSQAAQALRHVVLADRLPTTGSITIGLIGRGIGASLSPVMHEREGQRLGLDYRYHLIDFDRLGLSDDHLASVISEARNLGFAGVNVTYPFKQAVLPLLDTLAPDAASIGAINTVVFGDKTEGHNTDCWGFAESFRQGLPHVDRSRVLQLGSGGAGAAVSQALLQCGVDRLDIFDIDQDKAKTLAQRLRDQFGAEVRAVDDAAVAASASGIVNTTPIGMAKHPGLPIAADLLDAKHWIADVVYFPLETAFVALGRQRGCAILPGGGMAVYQAVRAFELFSDHKPDATAMAETFRQSIKG